MQNRDRKRIGFFIKKNNKLLKTLNLKDYSFEDLCKKNLLYHDNTKRTLIYNRLHHQDEIQSGVRGFEPLKKELRDPEMIPPILMPIDFTNDWIRQQERASQRKKGRFEDEDGFAFELNIDSILSQNKKRKKKSESNKSEEKTEQQDENKDGITAHASELSSASISNPKNETSEAQVPEEPVLEKKFFEKQKHNLDEVSKVIKSIPMDEKNQNEYTDPSELAVKIKDQQNPTAAQEEFIPVNTTQTKDNEPIIEPEKEAMQQYKNQQANQEKMAHLEHDIEEAKKQGYEDGYRLGEEKATVEAQERYQQQLNKLNEIITELNKTKKELLLSADKNYFEIAQAVAEALTEHEFKINPEVFAQVIRKAINDTLEDDQYRIRVHPSFYEELKSLNLADLDDKLIKDDTIEPGNFKIDAQHSVVDGNIKEVIQDLLSQADIHLQTTDKAG